MIFISLKHYIKKLLHSDYYSVFLEKSENIIDDMMTIIMDQIYEAKINKLVTLKIPIHVGICKHNQTMFNNIFMSQLLLRMHIHGYDNTQAYVDYEHSKELVTLELHFPEHQ